MGHEVELATLKIQDAAWPGWEIHNAAVWKARWAGDKASEDEVLEGIQLFQAFYDRRPRRWPPLATSLPRFGRRSVPLPDRRFGRATDTRPGSPDAGTPSPHHCPDGPAHCAWIVN